MLLICLIFCAGMNSICAAECEPKVKKQEAETVYNNAFLQKISEGLDDETFEQLLHHNPKLALRIARLKQSEDLRALK